MKESFVDVNSVTDDETRKILQWLAIQDRETLLAVMAYEKRQFSAGTSSLSMQLPHETYSNLYAFSRLGKIPQGHATMEIGLTRKLEDGTVRLSQSMHIGYAYAFHNAFLKAINWIAPVQGLEHVERY